ncbi:MAG: choice-of-anchor D domain-containing protein, partial [Candidatus Poribacteria bacterium]
MLYRNHRLIAFIVFSIIYFSVIGSSNADRAISPLQPDSIVIVSGNNQSGYAGTILPNPLVVKILNVNGKALPLAEVKFAVVSGGGAVAKISSSYSNEVSTVTDSAGLASVKFRLGLTKEVNRVRVTSGDAQPVEFTATVLNSKPKLNPISNKEINEGETLQFKVTATDADQNDILILSTSALWQNATFNSSTGVFTFNPDYNQAGTYQITFSVTDGTDIASEQITITVKNINRPPILNPIGDRTISEGTELIIVVSAIDPDGDPLTYSVSGMPSGATFNNTQRIFRWKPGYDTVVNATKKDFVVIFIVSDTSGAIDLKSVTITVNDAEPIVPNIRVLPLLPDGQIGLDFESVEVGETADRIFQIHNDGNAPLKLISIAETDAQFKLLTYIKTHSNIIDPIDPHIIKLLDEASILALIGSNEQFFDVEYSPNDPLLTINYPDLNPGECLLIRAQFKPLSVGQKTAKFVIKSDDPDELVVFMNLKGIGTLTPDIRVSTNDIDFGNVQVGKNSDKQLTIFNDGKGVLNIKSITSDDPQFSVLGYSNVNPNSSIAVTIRFTPNSIGNKSSILRINSNDPDESWVLVNLQGTGFKVPSPDINLSTTNINFGEVQVGKSLTKNFQIQNLGDALLQITNITSSNSQFTVTGMANVPVGGFITISVKFTPTSSGSKAGIITILSNDPDEASVTVAVQGVGVVIPTPNIRVSPSTLNFGDVEIGQTVRKNFYIYNDGNATLEINRITTSDNQFMIVDDPNVPAGSVAVISVDFKPTSLGQKEAIITISSNDPDEPTKTITAKGKGISPPAPDIRLSNTSLDFGDVQVGESKVLYLNIFNDGNLPLVLNSLTTNNEQFAVIWDSQNVPVNGYVTISVRFSPILTGLKTATLTITSNDPDEQTVTVSLQGRGYEVPVPDIEIYPPSIDFGSVEIGKSLIKTFRIYNRGNALLQITSITSSNSQFTTINSATILGGTSLLVQVSFAPISLGSKTATLTLVSNDPDESVTTVSLYGDGVYPGYVNIGVWSKVQQTNIVNDLYDVFFTNENRGWAVGYNGTIINSINGGTAWTLQESGTARTLNSVFFVDQLTGWAVGQYGTILKTTNGGLSWSQIGYSIANTLWSIKFINPIKGWSVGEYGSVWTINDGIWNSQNSNQTFDLFDVDFINYNQGWAIGSYGTIIRTIDGGQTWTPQQSLTTETLFGLDFINANEGWAVGTNGTILKTANGGQTWVRQNSNVNFETLYDVDFIDSNYGWVVGNNGIILHTIDGGITWVRIDSGTNKALRAVYFINPEAGWIVGANGTIL